MLNSPSRNSVYPSQCCSVERILYYFIYFNAVLCLTCMNLSGFAVIPLTSNGMHPSSFNYSCQLEAVFYGPSLANDPCRCHHFCLHAVRCMSRPFDVAHVMSSRLASWQAKQLTSRAIPKTFRFQFCSSRFELFAPLYESSSSRHLLHFCVLLLSCIIDLMGRLATRSSSSGHFQV
jgi:hypothetical protein